MVGGQGCTWGSPEPSCHSAITWHCRICNAPGQDKGGIDFISQPYDELSVASQISGLKMAKAQQIAVFPHYLSMKTWTRSVTAPPRKADRGFSYPACVLCLGKCRECLTSSHCVVHVFSRTAFSEENHNQTSKYI